MKSLLNLFFLFFTTTTFAADLVVEPFGVAPAYSTIQAAINAASNGDRILIKSRPGGIPWVQALTISKNIQLLSFDNDSVFHCQGDVTIDLATATAVDIIGMYNHSGNLVFTGTGSTKSCNLSFLDSYINGNIEADNNSVVLECAASEVRGYVHFSHGNLIGNHIQGGVTFVGMTGNYLNETVKIIGNKCFEQVLVEDGNYNFHIMNNLVDIYGSSYSVTFPVLSFETTGGAAFQNLIYNNSLKWSQINSRLTYNTTILSVFTNTGTGHSTEIMNNTIYGYYSYNGISDRLNALGRDGVNGTVNLYFNHIDLTNQNEPSKVDNIRHNSVFTTNFANNNTLLTNLSTTAVDGGNPATPFYDLDLTPNDAGAYGGSYTLDNFFPLRTGSARIYMIDYPFNVRQGSTLNIEASSFDR